MRKFPKFSTLRVTLLSVVAFALLLTPRAYATFANFVVVQLQGQCTDASQPASCSLIESAEHDLFSGTATAFGDSSGLHALASVG